MIPASMRYRWQSPRLEGGERIYAIGDVHGRYDLLRNLLDTIEIHSARQPGLRRPKIILLGDLIDRGAESARVIRFLMNVQRHTDRVTVLRGNHEEMMLRVIDGDDDVERPWLEYGGAATVLSMGLTVPVESDPPGLLGGRLHEALGNEVVQWLRELPLAVHSGGYFFCHAGVRPGVRLDRQNRDDMLWIRDEFLHSTADHGAVVVHGHSESIGVEIRQNRIGVDTGAYRTGILSCLYLEGAKREVIVATSDPARHDRRCAPARASRAPVFAAPEMQAIAE